MRCDVAPIPGYLQLRSMKFKSNFFLAIILCCTQTHAQTLHVGEFLSKKGDYLRVLNDSQLTSTITRYESVNVYKIVGDSLIALKKGWITDGKGTRDSIFRESFRILSNNRDTFSVQKYFYKGKPYESIDTITFVKLDRL